MFTNYLKAGWRNLVKNKVYSFINIFGLAMGMAVTMLIAFWMHDEFSFNKYHAQYNRIAQVMQQQTFQGETNTYKAIPIPLAADLHQQYGDDFRYMVLSSWTNAHQLSFNNRSLSSQGNYMEPDAAEMLTLKMVKGSRAGLKDPASILLSASLAQSIFAGEDPINKILQLDNDAVKVTGVYEDIPYSSSFQPASFIAPWSLYVASDESVKSDLQNWNANSYQLFAQINEKADMAAVSTKIKNIRLVNADAETAQHHPEIFLQPMSRWHLYQEFKNGKNTGGDIQYVWLFGGIGAFVLLLACINFMNLSTARSAKRAKEVGIRKAVGSQRGQLIAQFFCESVLTVSVSFVLAILLLLVMLPFLNEITGKKIHLLWDSPFFWLLSLAFILLTGLIAGSYPAFYLSAFRPLKVLKGTFQVGRSAAIPRQVLVVLQFSVAVILIIGVMIIFRQIQFSKDRPTGYTREGLVIIKPSTTDFHDHFDAMYRDLLQTGAITAMAESSNTITKGSRTSNGFGWKGKSPDMTNDFSTIGVSADYGKAVSWQFAAGKDFSGSLPTDISGLILNEAAVKYMGLKDPVGELITWNDKQYTVIGVIHDIVMESPYERVKQAVYYVENRAGNLNIRIHPAVSTSKALTAIEAICKKYVPSFPFEYKFADAEYARKFGTEERICKLAFFLATLAIFISCLGLFGLASFVAEQRTKEIGIRKILGATVLSVWQLLSKEFILLVVLAYALAAPLAYYFLQQWLQHYTYHTEIPVWIFVLAGAGTMTVTLLTVSFQAIKAAVSNPIKSLQTD